MPPWLHNRIKFDFWIPMNIMNMRLMRLQEHKSEFNSPGSSKITHGQHSTLGVSRKTMAMKKDWNRMWTLHGDRKVPQTWIQIYPARMTWWPKEEQHRTTQNPDLSSKNMQKLIPTLDSPWNTFSKRNSNLSGIIPHYSGISGDIRTGGTPKDGYIMVYRKSLYRDAVSFSEGCRRSCESLRRDPLSVFQASAHAVWEPLQE